MTLSALLSRTAERYALVYGAVIAYFSCLAYYHAHIKPRAKPAPEKKKGFVCTVCGYVYEGDVLPPDFICPLCKHPASDFVPVE